MFEFNSLSKQLKSTYTFFLLVVIISSLIILNHLTTNKFSEQKVEYIVNPSLESSLRLLSGVTHYMATLKSWRNTLDKLESARLVQDTHNIWEAEVVNNINKLELYFDTNNDSTHRDSINDIKNSLYQLQRHTHEIETIVNNQSSLVIPQTLVNEVLEQGDILLNAHSNVINIERELGASVLSDKRMATLTDVRTLIIASIESINAFALSGDKQHQHIFEQNWKKSEVLFQIIDVNKRSKSKKLLSAYAQLKSAREAFIDLQFKVFNNTNDGYLTDVTERINTKAIPLASEIKVLIENLIESENNRVKQYADSQSRLSYLKWLLIFLITTGFGMSVYVGVRSIRSVKTSLDGVKRNIKKMTDGELNIEPTQSDFDEVNQLSGSVKSLSDELLKRNLQIQNEAKKLADEDWVLSNTAAILQNLQGYVCLNEWANDLLNNLVPKVDGLVGVLYIKQKDATNSIENIYTDQDTLNESAILRLVGTYAYLSPASNKVQKIHLGEGLIGQCALTQQYMHISKGASDELTVNSALINTTAKHISLMPITFEGDTLGVIEIGWLEECSAVYKALLMQVMTNIGVILKTVLARIETEDLLKFLNAQNLELNENAKNLIEANILTDNANKDLAAQKTAMDQHSLVSVTDIEGIITYANDKFCAISGYSRDELIGKNHRILNSNQQPKDYWREMFNQVSQGEYWHDEVCNRAKDGHFYWVDTTIVPLYDIDN
uniref:PAS domain S-box protein n=1 Tax=uncultured Psychrosphaera sp. TaxID=1403522 RepID=UPI0030F5C7D9